MIKNKLLVIIIIVIFLVTLALIWYKKDDDNNYTKIEPEGTISNINYKIYDNYKQGNYDYSKRGYYITTLNRPNSPYYYIITMGKKNTGGHSISVVDLTIDEEKNVEVIVKETKKKSHEEVTMTLMYPSCCLELNTYPNNIIIKNTDGEVFKKINYK